MPLDYLEMTLEEVLRTYSSVKGHRTHCEREIQNLLTLLKVQCSSTLETRITDFLLTAKYTKAKVHQDEVAEFLAVLDECANKIFTIFNNRHAAAPAAVIAAQAAPAPAQAPAKPLSAELKPDKLSHEASMASFRTWKKQFRAYYDSGHIGSLPCTQQQAYLNHCVDDALCAKVDREATRTTPAFSSIQGLMTCMTILDNTFLEINLIHLRRKQFFDARQEEGQSVIEFREELLSLMDEADGANFGVNELI